MLYEIKFKDGETLMVDAEDYRGTSGWLVFEQMVDTEVEEPQARANNQGVEMVKVVRPRPHAVCRVNLSEIKYYRPAQEDA